MTLRHDCKCGLLSMAVSLTVLAIMIPDAGRAAEGDGLWSVYEQSLKGAKYVDLTHTITPNIPVWAGFAASTFSPAKAGSDIEGYVKTGEVYSGTSTASKRRNMRSRPINSARSSIRRPTGHPNIRRSMSCRLPTRSGPSPSYRSSSS